MDGDVIQLSLSGCGLQGRLLSASRAYIVILVGSLRKQALQVTTNRLEKLTVAHCSSTFPKPSARTLPPEWGVISLLRELNLIRNL